MKTPATAPWARTAFGIDLTDLSPIIIKATRTGRTLSFEPVALSTLATLPATPVVAGSLLQKESFTRWLTAPIASAKKAEKVFPSLLDVQLPFSVEDCETALLHTVPTPDRTGTRGLVTGARTVDIEKRLAAFSSLGVSPALLDQEGLALWSQMLDESPFAATPALRIIVYLSTDRVTLALGQNDEFLGAHTMRLLDADQIHRLLKSYFPTPPPLTQWLITGPHAPSLSESGPLLPESLHTRWPGPAKLTRDPATFFARALATRALTAGALRCNLRTGRFLHPALAQRQAKRPTQWAVTCLLAGLVLCAINLAWLVFVTQQTAGLQTIFRSLAIEVTGSPLGIPAGQEVLTARRALEAQTRAMEPFLAAMEAPIAPALKNLLVVAQEEGLSVETLSLSRKNRVLHGTAPKWAQAEATCRRLNTQGWAATLERKDLPPGEDRVAFVIGLGRSHEK
jgi:hypothetical protein